MPRQFKVISVNRINKLLLSQLCNKSTSSCILTKWATHGPESKLLHVSNVNDWKHKSSSINMLCDDLVLFRPRSKNLSPVCNGTAFLFVKQSKWKPVQRKPQHVEQNARNQNKGEKWPSLILCHKNESQSLFKNLEGRPICTPKNLGFWRLQNKIRMRSRGTRERNQRALMSQLIHALSHEVSGYCAL